MWWGYRYFFTLPTWMDELVVKPIVFGWPVVVFRWSNWGKWKWRQIGLGVALGVVLAGIQMGVWLVRGEAVWQFNIWDLVVTVGTVMAEEVLFRGVIMDKLENMWAAIMFAGIHVPLMVKNGLGIDTVLYGVVAIGISGFVYGLVRKSTGSLWPAMAVHYVENVLLGIVRIL